MDRRFTSSAGRRELNSTGRKDGGGGGGARAGRQASSRETGTVRSWSRAWSEEERRAWSSMQHVIPNGEARLCKRAAKSDHMQICAPACVQVAGIRARSAPAWPPTCSSSSALSEHARDPAGAGCCSRPGLSVHPAVVNTTVSPPSASLRPARFTTSWPPSLAQEAAHHCRRMQRSGEFDHRFSL